jgi:hypothetical protein
VGIDQELERTADVLWNDISRPWCDTFVVNSNHDRHLVIWLKEADWRDDPTNAVALLRLTLYMPGAHRGRQAVQPPRICAGHL